MLFFVPYAEFLGNLFNANARYQAKAIAIENSEDNPLAESADYSFSLHSTVSIPYLVHYELKELLLPIQPLLHKPYFILNFAINRGSFIIHPAFYYI
jgi:hypothetical protein